MINTISNFFHNLFCSGFYNSFKDRMEQIELRQKEWQIKLDMDYEFKCSEFDRKRREAGTIED